MTAASRTATRFLSAERTAHLLREAGMPNVMETLAGYIAEDFRRWPDFDKCARVANHSPDGVIELMPVADTHRYAFKYVNGHPKNARFNLPTVMAFGVLADVDTGLPRLISELTLMTAVRTAAMSALAARSLAKAGSRRMALIGNGAQSEFQALAFNRLLGIDTFHLFDTDPAATDKLAAHLDALGLHAMRFDSTAAAVRGVDIITTATADKANATIVTPEMLEAGMHINGVGGDCPGKTELHAEVLRRSRVFVEYAPQTRIEGEIQQMPEAFPVTELWTVLTGTSPGRTRDDEITVFDSVGFALEDYSALRFLADLADASGVADTISLIPDLPEPKDLFSLVASSGTGTFSQANLAA